jgi:hypothetical protein
MARLPQAGLENSIAHALGALYEVKQRGTTLIRVLEDYRRVQETHKSSHRSSQMWSEIPEVPRQELDRLRMRRAALDQVIRSFEAYRQASAQADR